MKRVLIYRSESIFIAAFAIAMAMLNGYQARATRPDDSIGSSMVLLNGGAFLMGTPSGNGTSNHEHGPKITSSKASVKDPAHEVGDEDERPAHRVTLSSFHIDATEVTNLEFSNFVKATGYKTDAEKRGSSWVFKQGMNDWTDVNGADWRHPLGPASTIADKMDHPVVNVSWNDPSNR